MSKVKGTIHFSTENLLKASNLKIKSQAKLGLNHFEFLILNFTFAKQNFVRLFNDRRE